MANLGWAFPKLIEEFNLPFPKKSLWFLIHCLLNGLLLCLLLIKVLKSDYDLITSSVSLSFFPAFHTSKTISMATIGITLEKFCQDVEKSKNLFKQNVSMEKINALRNQLLLTKKVAAPFLLIIFANNFILIINSAFVLFRPALPLFDKGIFISVLLSSVWDLYYLTVCADETLNTYKSLDANVR